MLINKWLVVDSFNNNTYKEWHDGLCLSLHDELNEISSLFKALRERTAAVSPFVISLSGTDMPVQKETFFENLISLFFQPSYYRVNCRPLVFLNNKTQGCFEFIERLLVKCKRQGLDILIIETKNNEDVDHSISQYAYEVTSPEINYDSIIENWLSQYMEDKNPGEIHLLIPGKETYPTELLDNMLEKERLLSKTEQYKFAKLAYQKQTMIDQLKHELDLKIGGEKDTRLYLSMQKKQTADNVEWYHHEYEILPTWYKRLGHVIKVLMGKRTFRSLFNDKVKKNKD